MLLLILYLILALGFSFLCSILESVLLSITPSYVATLEREGSPAGESLRKLKQDVDRPLSAILSLNTIAHTVGAVGVGDQANRMLGPGYAGIVGAVLTLAILVFSEIIPKSLGARYWKKLAPLAGRFLPWLIRLLYPLVWVSNLITSTMGSSHGGPTLSREEFHALTSIVTEEGIFDEKETVMLRNLSKFSSLTAKDIMTPRTVIVGFDEEATVTEALQDAENLRFSRLPVYEEDRDEVTGYVLKHDLLLRYAHGEGETQLRDLKRPIVVLPSIVRVPDLLEQLLTRKEHLALIVGEYGGTAGIVTLEDVVETMLGLEIVDEVDAVEDMQAMARQQWLKRAEGLGIVPDSEVDEVEPDKAEDDPDSEDTDKAEKS